MGSPMKETLRTTLFCCNAQNKINEVDNVQNVPTQPHIKIALVYVQATNNNIHCRDMFAGTAVYSGVTSPKRMFSTK